MPRLRSNAPLVLSLLLALALVPRPTRAAPSIVVGNGTATSCTETALRDALLLAERSGGATIGFRCGHAPLTITLSHVTEMPRISVFLVIPDSTSVDGAGLVALQRGVVPGGGEAALVFVGKGTTAQLKGLSLLNAVAPTQFAGGIVNLGTLTVSECTVSGHSNNGGGAGGIWNAGTLGIVESTVSDNAGRGVGGILNVGTLEIRRSVVAGNSSRDGAGGGIANEGTLTVERSEVSRNQADRSGGGIVNRGVLSVRRSALSENRAVFGGAIDSSGTLRVQRSTVSGNGAAFGAGIFNRGVLTVEQSVVTRNTASVNGGGIYNCVEGDALCSSAGTTSLTHTTVTENAPDDVVP